MKYRTLKHVLKHKLVPTKVSLKKLQEEYGNLNEYFEWLEDNIPEPEYIHPEHDPCFSEAN